MPKLCGWTNGKNELEISHRSHHQPQRCEKKAIMSKLSVLVLLHIANEEKFAVGMFDSMDDARNAALAAGAVESENGSMTIRASVAMGMHEDDEDDMQATVRVNTGKTMLANFYDTRGSIQDVLGVEFMEIPPTGWFGIAYNND